MLTYEKQIKTRGYKLFRPAAAERMFCLPTSISSNDVRGSGSSAEWDFPTPTTATWAWSWENQYHLLPWLHKVCLLLLSNHFSYLGLVSFPDSYSLLSRVGVWQSGNETNVAWFQHFSTYVCVCVCVCMCACLRACVCVCVYLLVWHHRRVETPLSLSYHQIWKWKCSSVITHTLKKMSVLHVTILINYCTLLL